MSTTGQTPTIQTGVQPAPAPLSPEQMDELGRARARWRKVQRCVTVARLSAWSLAIAAALTLVIGVFDRTAAIAGVVLAAITFNEFRGASKLRRAMAVGPILLGWNQMLLLASIGAYCFYQIFLVTPKPLVSDPRVADMLNDPVVRDAVVAQLGPNIMDLFDKPDDTHRLFYLVVAGLSLIVQGLTALYYFSRRRVVMAYLNATPAWVVEVQRRAA